MQLTPPVRVQTRRVTGAPGWELGLRYGAAYICTLVAVAAAQLKIPTDFAVLLAIVTLLGLPVSLYLRATRLRVGSWHLQRPLVNSAIVVIASLTSLYRFHDIIPLLPRPDGPSISHFLVNYSTEFPFEVLMQVFLLFAVWRCMTIINDNDAVLCSLASFPILLLLIVVHKGIEVVAYFLVWALASALLFALDHRAEARHDVVARLPAVEPGQDVRLSARSLATVLGFSLICALLLSYGLTNRENDERSKAETWLALLASRLTRLALDMPDSSVNSGPERQIDFTSAPSLPSHRPLWFVEADHWQHRTVRPEYWRMFTLGKYDGAAWSQIPRDNNEDVRMTPIPISSGARLPPGRYDFSGGPAIVGPRGEVLVPEFNIAAHSPNFRHQFGWPTETVAQTIIARSFNYGFVPLLPSVRQLRITYHSPDVSGTTRITARRDGSAEIGVLDPGGSVNVVSEIPPGPEYGGATGHPPHLISDRPNPGALLPPSDRQTYLELPSTLPPGNRLRRLAQQLASHVDQGASDYVRAKRLEQYLLSIGTYTLHPPSIPAGQDAADYFIFKSRRGYCTYFAGALTALCRAAGMPARVVTGFVNAEWRPDAGGSIIYESNAHAWTEVWIPNWGWATLDATPGDDRGNNAPRWWDAWTEMLTSTASNAWQWIQIHAVPAIAAAFFLCAAAALFISWRMGLTGARRAGLYIMSPRLRWMAARASHGRDNTTRQMVVGAYRQAARDLARRFRRRAPWETPVEWLAAAEAALNLQDPEPLRRLTNLYTQARYAPGRLDAATATTAYEALANLSWQRSQTA